MKRIYFFLLTSIAILSCDNSDEPGNTAPTNIELSNNTIEENSTIGTIVGTLTAVDNNSSNHTFTLVAGEGDDNNGAFSISNGSLQSAAEIDFENTPQLTIRIQADDHNGGVFQKTFVINVIDLEDGVECQLIKTTVTTPDDSYYYNHFYNNATQLVIKEIFKGSAIYDSTLYTYNDNGKIIQQTSYIEDVVNNEINYSYNESGLVSYTLEFGANDEFIQRWHYEYDGDSQQPSKVVQYDETGVDATGSYIEYTYDSEGHTLTSKNYGPDRNGNLALLDDWSFEYNTEGSLIKEISDTSGTEITHIEINKPFIHIHSEITQ